MTRFESLFGVKSSDIRKNCILMPLLPRNILAELKIEGLSKGKLYSTVNTDGFSLIHTGLGTGLTGDAVLHLKESLCRNVFLFGSCGLVKETADLSIGSLVVPSRCYSNESFTDMLLERKEDTKSFSADRNLIEAFLFTAAETDIKKVTCSTVSSLKLEEDMQDSFVEKGIDVVDMECSAFFSASWYNSFSALAFFYVRDIIKERPFYVNLDSQLRSKVDLSVKNACFLLCRFIKEKLND